MEDRPMKALQKSATLYCHRVLHIDAFVGPPSSNDSIVSGVLATSIDSPSLETSMSI